MLDSLRYLFNLADPGLPFPMLNQIRTEIPFYHDQGMRACSIECKPAWGYHGPALYLVMKLMWNPRQDFESLLEDYFTRFYGSAADPMRAHFDRLERAYAEADHHTGNTFDIPHILTPPIMAQMDASLKEAKRLAAGDATYAARVHMTRIAYDCGHAR